MNNQKTIGFKVPVEYGHSGTEFRKAVDTLFSAMWEMLEDKQEILAAQYPEEIDILNWEGN